MCIKRDTAVRQPWQASDFAIPLVAAGVFALHALILGSWIIDDAGISFAYARDLAHGYGLAAQPGVAPVEGYSNFLWILLIAPFYLTHTFSPLITPKIIGIALIALSFVVLARSLARTGALSARVVLAGLCLIAMQPAFVIWCVSGLENPLYVLLISSLFAITLDDVSHLLDGQPVARLRAAGAGIVVAAVAMTRPDGAIYLAAYPCALLVAHLVRRRSARQCGATRPGLVIPLLHYAAGFAVPFGAFIAFRLIYFHAWFPNTYYVKGGPTPKTLLDILLLRQESVDRLLRLLGSTTLYVSTLWTLILLIAATYYVVKRRLVRFPHVLMLGFLVLSIADFLLMPRDWMGSFRFATPVYVFFYLYIASIVAEIATAFAPRLTDARVRKYLRLAGVGVIGMLAFGQVLLTVTFASNPTVSLARVRKTFGHRYDRCADIMGIRHASELVPDLGGTLLQSNLRVFDLAGLCDRTIARTLAKNPQLFYDYVFDDAKPTFINLHGIWIRYADLDADPRFARDYILVHRVEGSEEWRDYVRRDAIAGRMDLLPELDAAIAQSDAAIKGRDVQQAAQTDITTASATSSSASISRTK